jgi:hypothetical protein
MEIIAYRFEHKKVAFVRTYNCYLIGTKGIIGEFVSQNGPLVFLRRKESTFPALISSFSENATNLCPEKAISKRPNSRYIELQCW